MEIQQFPENEKTLWNQFVKENYPPIGAFMQTWEWGEFQVALGRKIERYHILNKGKQIACFTLVYYSLPYKLMYGYIPRGPVIAEDYLEHNDMLPLFQVLQEWAETMRNELVFLRLEPPVESFDEELLTHGFHVPSYYIQPRFNHAISIDVPPEQIIQGFHPSTRSNISRAERRGVHVEMKHVMTDDVREEFFSMIGDTVKRNNGKNVYPQAQYFDALINTIPVIREEYVNGDLKLGIFFGYQDGEPAALNIVLFFGETATYLYGASYSHKLNSKVTTYLHYQAMLEAQKKGMKLYDIGGIDMDRWPSLTNFKRQFRGNEYHYAGNIDIPIRKKLHKAYTLIKWLKHS